MAFSIASQLASSGSQWSIKNTFVHCHVNAHEDTTSKWNVKTDITAARDASALSYLRNFLCGVATTRDLSSQFKDLEAVSSGMEDQQDSSTTDDEHDSQSSNGTDQRAIFSLGAEGHSKGTCKPCAWNWKDGGCSKGANCDFCHLCEEGTVKKRRREKVARLRSEEKAAKQAQKAGKLFGGAEAPIEP
mmetsp:Transcript_123729/g.194080  ORF Transcript_123729/g.194080 Transcript_123729/m.194080 type:complete len:188 (+) Transcript_123729:77-640(+)|eukprot:CAMPEP_0169102276 /NCGR_PEP_ID=MMETSP1015-20121227/22078_1 /TAXON_ID=342587 /ORGANISM="Karlodinium micrum, Strain CCMP2283" /LENGTH=187 /DNA_ID=CAMNT_0009163361 /DNA_START=77 /DNA_END=640 /DNA_ORIENTATION=-